MALSASITPAPSVAQAHRRLYTSGRIATMALDQHIRARLGDLPVSAREEGGIVLSLDADPAPIDPDCVVAVGIIATEPVINAMKYAYADGAGPAHVRLARQGERMDFGVADEGAGLGDRIIRAMAAKPGTKPVLDLRPRGLCARAAIPPPGPQRRTRPGASRRCAQMRGTMMSRSTGLPPRR